VSDGTVGSLEFFLQPRFLAPAIIAQYNIFAKSFSLRQLL